MQRSIQDILVDRAMGLDDRSEAAFRRTRMISRTL